MSDVSDVIKQQRKSLKNIEGKIKNLNRSMFTVNVVNTTQNTIVYEITISHAIKIIYTVYEDEGEIFKWMVYGELVNISLEPNMNFSEETKNIIRETVIEFWKTLENLV